MWIESNVKGMFCHSDTLYQDQAVITEVYHLDTYGIRQLDHGQMKRIVDVGGHIGSFCKTVTTLNPDVEVVTVEAHPALYQHLLYNLKHMNAHVRPIEAALYYDDNPLVIHSSVYAGCPTTGGSFVLPADDNRIEDYSNRSEYKDVIPVESITLEEILDEMDWNWIDVLKLDCEGSEFSIMENADLSKVKLIVGEWHHRAGMFELVARKFKDWEFVVLREGHLGVFQLHNRSL